MKIIQVIPTFGYGGAETMVEALSKYLQQQGHSVIVISLYNIRTEHTDRLVNEGIRVLFLDKKKGFDISAIYRLSKILRKEKPDAVHNHLYSLKYAAIAAKFARMKVVVHTVHNTAQKEMGVCDRRFNRFLYHRWGVTPVALSKEIRTTILEEYGLKEENVPVIFNGIDLRGNLPKNSYKIRDKLRVIHVGRFQEQKNHRCILEAANILKNHRVKFEIRLFGEGGLIEEIKRYAQELNVEDCVFFMGTSENVPMEMRDSDVFILPSLWEGMPMTIIEAMSVGLPIIASDVGGVAEMIKNENNGLLIHASPEELAKAVSRLYDDERLRLRLGTAAYESSTCFSADEMACNYANLYQRMAN